MVQGDARLDESDGESTVIFQSEDGLSDATLLASPAPDISAAGPSTEDERVAPPCSLDEVSEPAARRRQGGELWLSSRRCLLSSRLVFRLRRMTKVKGASNTSQE
ncbi:uncharacterized protein LOC144103309 [Amblyomma americanum]